MVYYMVCVGVRVRVRVCVCVRVCVRACVCEMVLPKVSTAMKGQLNSQIAFRTQISCRRQ